jgi:hypothetical protein
MTEKKESHSNYKGFVAGVFSGIGKLSGMPHPHSFDNLPPPRGWKLPGRGYKFDKITDMQEDTDLTNL